MWIFKGQYHSSYTRGSICLFYFLSLSTEAMYLSIGLSTCYGAVPEGEAVTAGGGADHIRTATAQPGQDEGNQEDLQV